MLVPKCRAWFEYNGRPVFGDGRARLLEAIARTGSIKNGAAALDMSYRNAWGHINHMEQRLGVKLIERQTGGLSGGGSRLTAEAEELLRAYHAYRKALDRTMPTLWRKAVRRK